jgi:hypothetical protein
MAAVSKDPFAATMVPHRTTPRMAGLGAALGQRFQTLAEHWNGTSWTVAASPSPGRGDDWLFGISAIPNGGGFWAVGRAGPASLTEYHC